MDQVKASSIEEFRQRYGLSAGKVYKMLAAGELRAVKIGTRTAILGEDERAWRDSLPTMGAAKSHSSARGIRAGADT